MSYFSFSRVEAMERCRRESVEGYLFPRPRILTAARLLNVGLIHGDERDLVERAGFSKPGFFRFNRVEVVY